MPNSKSNHNNTNSVISKPNVHTNLQAARLSKVSTSVNTNHSVDNQDVTMQNSTSENWILAQSKKNATKRNLSSSSSEPNSPKTQPNKKLFFYPSIPTKPTLSTSNEPNQEGNINVGIKSTLPPPIFVKGVICFTDLCSELIELIGVDNFSCKSSTDRLKILTTNPASYRTLIHFLKDQKAEYHTYQLKEDKPTRVVIRNLHPSTSTELIKTELELRLFEVRQVTNVLHKINKHPLPLFFVDLEPTIQSNDIYKLTSLIHTIIKVEEPYKSKTISQCINCRDYGYTKSYCGYPARCVRCGALHSSSACPNPRDATPKCALCSGDHPSNYKGCSVYKDLQHRNKPKKGKLLSDNFSHKKNVQLVLQEKRIDIALISETHFTKYSHIPIPGYQLLKSNHPDNSAHGGAAIYIKTSLSFQSLPNCCQPHFSNISPPPRLNINIQSYLDYFSTFSQNFIIGGDYNAKHSSWSCRTNNPRVLLTVSASPPIRPSLPKLFHHSTNRLKFHDLVDQNINLRKIQYSNVNPSVPEHIPTKSLLKYKPPLVPIINPHGGFASTDVEKAELFKEHLTETFSPHPDIQIPSHTDIVNRLLDIPPSTSPAVKHFSPGEVKFAIQKYSLKKSPGFDLITAEVARSLPKKVIVLLTVIYNAPILPNTQFGFRSAHSSIHQLHRLIDAISFSLEKKSYCSCVFLDISQAFDRVRVGTSFSGLAKISAGVPQEGILSPLLYKIYAADQPTSPYTTVAEFAYDKAIISIQDNPHIASLQLQHHLDLMAVWYKKWRIKVNQSKSLYTTFTLRLLLVLWYL
ncbi:hypothetical protein QTP88_009498 [Uroleucon formosanum]